MAAPMLPYVIHKNTIASLFSLQFSQFLANNQHVEEFGENFQMRGVLVVDTLKIMLSSKENEVLNPTP